MQTAWNRMGKIRLFPFGHFKMVAPRALVFRSLVKGNEDSGNEIATKNDQNAKNASITKVCHMGCRLFCHMKVCWRCHDSLPHGIQENNPGSSKMFLFFARTWAPNIEKFIFVWIVNEMTLYGYFHLQGQQKSLITPNGLNPRLTQRRSQGVH